jgi:putative ABC transport system permease protein
MKRISFLQVRYSGTHDEAVGIIDKAWSAVNPTLKSDYKDLEEQIKFFYNTVFGDVVNILGVVASLAILISCLGLLGMATYTIETRMKEISIRRVLGSTGKALVFLLSQGFLKLIGVSILIGVPAAWYINNLWLELMAYHTAMDVWVMAIGIFILLLLSGITICSQTIRAAYTNLVDNLKAE